MNNKIIKIACIGDSITWGYAIIGRKRNCFPSVLQRLLGDGYEVENFGFVDASARVDADTPYVTKAVFNKSHLFQPDIVMIMLGSNDTKTRNWDPEKYRRGYETIIDSYNKLESKPEIILLTPPHMFKRFGKNLYGLSEETMTNEVIPVIRSIASERKLKMIDINAVLSRSELIPDGVHPGVSGARLIAKTIADYLLF